MFTIIIMRIYFSGIGGVGIGPLSQIAKNMGHDVLGSDLNHSRQTDLISKTGTQIFFSQTGEELKKYHLKNPIDWFVYTSALPKDHPELLMAQSLGIKTSKRDEFLNLLITQENLKLIAVAGTHGKTTTTGLLIWVFKQLGVPTSYSVGSNISFGEIGSYQPGSKYFIYEADEFDRNFLQFRPYRAIISSVDYDHPDTYPSEDDYKNAFGQFVDQSQQVYLWQRDFTYLDFSRSEKLRVFDDAVSLSNLTLVGVHNRQNAYLVMQMVKDLWPETDMANLQNIINKFPGTQRRFEKLADNLYTDYAHHPNEIAATIQLAKELNHNVVVVYQPHQNVRQHYLNSNGGYGNVFREAKQVYWLPTYASRENPSLSLLPPEELIRTMSNPEIAQASKMDEDLVQNIKSHVGSGDLVVFMSAGNLDDWARENFTT